MPGNRSSSPLPDTMAAVLHNLNVKRSLKVLKECVETSFTSHSASTLVKLLRAACPLASDRFVDEILDVPRKPYSVEMCVIKAFLDISDISDEGSNVTAMMRSSTIVKYVFSAEFHAEFQLIMEGLS